MQDEQPKTESAAVDDIRQALVGVAQNWLRYALVVVIDEGEVRFSVTEVKQMLATYDNLCRDAKVRRP